MNTTDYHRDRWRDKLLAEVLWALAHNPDWNKALVFKGARILRTRLGRGRDSFDLDSSFSAEFIKDHPSPEQWLNFVSENLQPLLEGYFNGMDVVHYKLNKVSVLPRPKNPHRFGWNGVIIKMSVTDQELAGIPDLPDLDLEITAPEKYDDDSIGKLQLDSVEINAYTLERCVGEKFRAYLSSTSHYRQKIGRSEPVPLRVKDLYDIALTLRMRPIEDYKEQWKIIGQQFKLACDFRFVDCEGPQTFISTWPDAEHLYRNEPTLPQDIEWKEVAASLEKAVTFFAAVGILPFQYPLPSSSL